MQPFNPNLPLEEASTIPSSWYTNQEIYESELNTIFYKTWQLAGRTEQLTEKDSFFTFNLVNEPIIFTNNGEIKAYSNVCRHKATTLVNEPCGKAAKFRCRYHGWTYDTCGNLIGTPEFTSVKNFNKKDNCLPEFPVKVSGNFIFVNLTKDIPFNLDLPDTFNLIWKEQKTYIVNCNWKVFCDNYLDGGYHVGYVHPALATAIKYSEYKIEIGNNSVAQTSPLKECGISELRTGSAGYYWFFPNFMINLYEGVMDTNLVLPLGIDKCQVIFDFYFSPDKSEEYIKESIKIADKVQEEDKDICEKVQAGLKSKFYNTGRFSVKREKGAYYFHQLLAKELM